MDWHLGRESDRKVSYRLGVCTNSVQRRRVELGIPSVGIGSCLDDGPDVRRRLGHVSDAILAEELGVARQSIYKLRKNRRIPAYWRGERRKCLSPE